MDPTAAVRASAFKSLGALSQQDWAFSPLSLPTSAPSSSLPLPEGDEASLGVPSILSAADSLNYGLSDSVLSVRIAASWALGGLCESLGSRWSEIREKKETSPTDSSAEGPEMPRELIERAAEGCLVAMQDVDKVRSNGVRGLGVLLSFLKETRPNTLVPNNTLSPLPLTSLTSLLDKSLPGLQSCLTTGSMKVQWSACLAAQGLLTNPELWQAPLPLPLVTRITPLLLILIMLVRDCGNFKIRTHAAAALGASMTRGVYGDIFADAILVVLGAIDSTTSDLAGSVDAGGASSLSQEQADRSGEAAPGVKPFPNYRYVSGLSSQLRSTLLHLLSLAEASDATRLKDPLLTKKAEALVRALTSEAEERLKEAMMAFPEPFSSSSLFHGSKIDGRSEASQASPRLPVDPFEEGKGDAPSPSSVTTPLAKIKAMSVSYALHASKVPRSDHKDVISLVRGVRGLERLIQAAQKSGGKPSSSSSGGTNGMAMLNEMVDIANIIDHPVR